MVRKVISITKSVPTIEGAGVHLKRAFGFAEAPNLDPFLLLDDFHSSDPERYTPGFPWHPHRGIETITYLLHGEVEHGDSMGNKGTIAEGDVQWMTAGSGIIHQEMPVGDKKNLLWGFQLWANLPASQKMMEPRYRGLTAGEIPLAKLAGGVEARVICGNVGGVRGPVRDIVIEPEYIDITVPAGASFTHPVSSGHTCFAYVMEGTGQFDDKSKKAGPESLVIFGDGDGISVSAAGTRLRFLLVSGRPLREPVAWRGPIVMNTKAELDLAFKEFREGTFLRHKGVHME